MDVNPEQNNLEDKMTIESKTGTNESKAFEHELLVRAAERFFPALLAHAERDYAYFSDLIEDFADKLDITEELKQFHAWTLDQSPEKKINYRSRFRLWLRSAAQYQRPPIMRRYILQTRDAK